MTQASISSCIFSQLLPHCTTISFPPPWQHVSPRSDCYGPVRDPDKALAALSVNFPLAELFQAGVVDRSCSGAARLCPALVSLLAVIIPLRDSDNQPFALLTSRGCLPRSCCPLRAAFCDRWTQETLSRHGMLLATPHVREVALLQALDLPASLTLGLRAQPIDDLLWLDQHTAGLDYSPGAPEAPPHTAGAPPRDTTPVDGASPTPLWPVAFLGFSLLSLRLEPSSALIPLLCHLLQVRQYLGLALVGAMAWRLSAGELANLRFRLHRGRVPLVSHLLSERISSLVDLSLLVPERCSSAPAGLDFPAARAELLACLTESDLPDRSRLSRARAVYDEAIQRQLVQPLLRWALEHPNPIVSAAGASLAEVSHLLLRLGPALHGASEFGQPANDLEGAGLSLPPGLLAQYGTLLNRFGSLLRDLHRWRNG
jgi:hypothetical protein